MFPLLYALAACTEPPSDGPRWEPRDTSAPQTDTADEPTETGTEDTAPPVPTADTGTTTDGSCDGDGPISMVLGHGGRTNFAPYGNGDSLPIVVGPGSGEWGVTLELLTTGLDTRESMSAVMRVVTSNTDTTYIGVLLLQCPTPGAGWVSLHADFPNEDQSAAATGQFDGDDAHVTLTLTDHTDEFAEAVIDVFLQGP